MAALDYAALTKAQKIAAFLIVIGPEAASEVVKHFDNTQVESICREVAALSVLDEATQDAVLAEFGGVVMEGTFSLLGGVEYAQATLGKMNGDNAAILKRITPASGTAGGGDDFKQMETRQILELIKTEQPQTIAFILCSLEAPRAAEIMKKLKPEQREEVMARVAAMEATSCDILNKVAKNVTQTFSAKEAEPDTQRSGGVKTAADILNLLDRESRVALLASLDARDADLSAEIRKVAFSFEDLLRFDAKDLQRIVRDVDKSDLSKALKNSKPAFVDAILKCISKRAAEGMREDMEMMGALKAKEVGAAQDRIMVIVRKLEEAEEITLERGGDGAAA